MIDTGRHPDLTLLTYSEVEQVSGFIGQFSVHIHKRARSAIEKPFTSCGLCQEECPKMVLDTRFKAGLGNRAAVYRPFVQAVPGVPVIDRENCLFSTRDRCTLSEKACPTGAIDYTQKDQELTVQGGSPSSTVLAIAMRTGTATARVMDYQS
jgi:heterodisulfide reductase subunit A2